MQTRCVNTIKNDEINLILTKMEKLTVEEREELKKGAIATIEMVDNYPKKFDVMVCIWANGKTIDETITEVESQFIWLPIAILLIAALLSFIVIYICYKIGDRQYKKDYEKKYNFLKLLVEDSDDKGPLMKKEIKRTFDEISMYSCKNYEKLQVLEKAFIQKFSGKRHKEDPLKGIIGNSESMLVIDPRIITNF